MQKQAEEGKLEMSLISGALKDLNIIKSNKSNIAGHPLSKH